MANTTSSILTSFDLNHSNASLILSYDELLNTLGFSLWQTQINTFLLPPIYLIGIMFSSLSLWIFTRSTFVEPIFFYYKLLCFVNSIHLLHNIPYCILVTPRYFPSVNTYALSVYNLYYVFASTFFFHFEDVTHMGILLHKMKAFSPFVKKHFRSSPKFITFCFCVTCLLLDMQYILAYDIVSFGTYFYFDLNNYKHTANFFYLNSSYFSKTPVGRVLLSINIFFLNTLLCLIVGVALNVLFYIKYKKYARKRQREIESLQMRSIHNKPTIDREIIQFDYRERTDSKIEKNMAYMAITLCSMSILTRVLIIVCSIYISLHNTFSNSVLILMIVFFINSILPIVSIFIFYFFNEKFRNETNRILFRREPQPMAKIIFISKEIRY
jgi:hypothetical protein